ncbi:MAG: T9SS type A sorting domain-containing protein, partial [Saprospiraceae bacterium]|nr:T9SS type A sorting domain-containing protein [Saprospiraceae bacterium]
GASSLSIFNLAPGSYQVTATDANGCNNGATFTINEAPVLTSSVATTKESAPGTNDGGVDLSVMGGSGPYTYNWSTGATTQNINGLAGNGTVYYVTTTDAKNCSKPDSAIIDTNCSSLGTPCDDGDPNTYNDQEDGNCNCLGTPCPIIDLNLSTADITCFGANDGTATVNPSNGTAPYSIAWSTDASSLSISNLAPGNYQVTVTDANGCNNDAPFSGSEPLLLSSFVASTNESAVGANDGAANLSVMGGSGPYTYNWSTGATTQNINGLAGNGSVYYVTITDANNCSKTDSAIIETNCPSLGTPCDDGDADTYNDQEDGNCNCLGTPCPIIDLNLSTADITCFGANDGTATVNPSNGTAPYSITWSTSASSTNISNLAPGNYQVTVTDDHGCSAVEEALSINEPGVLMISAKVRDESLEGSKDGFIDLSVFGGTAPYSYLWSNGVVSQDLGNLSSEDSPFFIQVIDATGCSDTASFIVNTGCQPSGELCDDGDANTFDDQEDGDCSCAGIPCPSLTFTLSVAQISCNGLSDGTANLLAEGGTPPYVYKWSNGAEGNAISGLSAGYYFAVVTDSGGCSDSSTTFLIKEPSPLSLSFHITRESGQGKLDGAVEAIATGGLGPYMYIWSTGDSTSAIRNLAGEGNLYLTSVTDANGCTISDSAVLETDCPRQGTSCDDGNPLTFADTTDGNCLCIGTPCDSSLIQVKVMHRGCKADLGSATVIDSQNAVSLIHWSNGGEDTSVGNLEPGIYEVTLTYRNGCVSVPKFEILSLPNLSVTSMVTDISAPGLSDGDITLEIEGGKPPYKISWSTGDTTKSVSGLAPGTYGVSVEDAAGCGYIDSFHLLDISCEVHLAYLDQDLMIQIDTLEWCTDLGTISVFGVSDKPLVWSIDEGLGFQEQGTFTDLPAGTYELYVRDTLTYCQDLAGRIQLGPDLLSSSDLYTGRPSDCSIEDGYISITQPSGQMEISLHDSGPWFSDRIPDLKSGIYTVFARDLSDSCIYQASKEIIVGDPTEFRFDIKIDHVDPCLSDLGKISLSPAASTILYSIDEGTTWYRNQQTFKVSPGIYPLLVQDSLGCEYDTNIDLQVDILTYYPPAIEVSLVHPSACYSMDGAIEFATIDESVELSYDNGVTWTRDLVRPFLPAGLYQVLIREEGSLCLDTLSLELEGELQHINLDTMVLPPTCHGSKDGFIRVAVIDPVTNYDYLWNTGDTASHISSLQAGVYNLTITDGRSGCSRGLSYELSNASELNFNLPTDDSVVLCQGESLQLDLDDSLYRFLWYKDEDLLGDGAQREVTTPGKYIVTAIDSLGCEKSDTMLLSNSLEVFHANFLMASQAVVGELVSAIEISWPVPEVVEWEVLGGEIVDQDLNQAIIQFSEMGVFSVLLKANNGGCMSILEKSIQIVEDNNQLDSNLVLNPTSINSATLFPNPNTGNFNLLVELNEPSTLQIRIYDEQGILHFADQVGESDSYATNIDLGAVSPGVYTVLIQSEVAWTSHNVVIE